MTGRASPLIPPHFLAYDSGRISADTSPFDRSTHTLLPFQKDINDPPFYYYQVVSLVLKNRLFLSFMDPGAFPKGSNCNM
jgi:hypothetical protein